MDLRGLDLQAFIIRANQTPVDPVKVTRAARNLVDGALRIRTGNHGLLGSAMPVTRPAEAVGAWLKSLESDLIGGNFHRHNEAKEALIAAAEEVDEAVKAAPKASRLQHAFYADALTLLGKSEPITPLVPWIISGILGFILLGVFIVRRR